MSIVARLQQKRSPRKGWSRLGLLLLFALGLGCIQSAYAASFTEFFSVQNSSTDLSMKLLRVLFGGVGSALNIGTLAAAKNPLLGEMFRLLNTGVLTIAGVLIGYTVLMSTINIAQDGSQAFSGKVSPFVLLRVVTGCALLVPTSDGYSGIQIIVITIVVQGVAFANAAWNAAVEAVDQGASAFVFTIPDTTLVSNLTLSILDTAAGDNQSVISTPKTLSSYRSLVGPSTARSVRALDLYAMSLCTLVDQAQSGELVKQGHGFGYFIQMAGANQSSRTCVNDTSDTNAYICFGSTNKADDITDNTRFNAGKCGIIQFSGNDANSANSKLQTATSAIGVAYSAAMSHWSNRNVIIDADGNFNEDMNIFTDCDYANKNFSSWTTASAADSWSEKLTAMQAEGCSFGWNTLYGIGKAYSSALRSNFFQSQTIQDGSGSSNLGGDGSTSLKSSMQNNGWASAGQYYAELTQQSADTDTATSKTSTYSWDNYEVNIGSLVKRGTGSMPTMSSGDACASKASSPVSCNLVVWVAPRSSSSNDPTGSQLWASIGFPESTDGGMTTLESVPSGAVQTAAAQAMGDYWQAQANDAAGSSGSSGAVVSAPANNTPASSASCYAAKKMVAASTSLTEDMPAYLYSSNVIQPWNIFEAFGADFGSSPKQNAPYGGTGRDPTVATDHALHNMFLTIYMTLQALTGMKVFDQCCDGKGQYKAKASDVNLFNATCKSVINGADCTDGGSYFFTTLDNSNCILGTSSDNIQSAGLMSMVYLDESGSSVRPDPIRSLANMGMTMMRGAVLYYTVTMEQVFATMVTLTLINTGVTTAVKLVLALGNAYSMGTMEALFVGMGALIDAISQMMLTLDKYALELFLPLGSAVAAILFTQGVMLGVYLPFLAFLLYVFGVIGWLVAVVEAMVAAPLVALGITHPEGHDLFGQAESGLMLLLGVFLRPVAMIMGLFLAISLSQVALKLVNYGFLYVLLDYFTNMTGTDISVIGGDMQTKVVLMCTIGLFIVYSFITYSVLEMSFSLIYQIPDRILRWIGGPEQQSDAGTMAKSVGSQTKQMAQEGAGAAGQTQKAPQTGSGGAAGVSVGGAKQEQGNDDDDDDEAGSGTGSAAS